MKTLFLIAIIVRLSLAIYQPPVCPIVEVPPCAVRCPEVDQPICAVPDGWAGGPHTFGYMCQKDGYNCNCPSYPYEYLHDGPCDPDCSIPIACPRIYQPVCTLPNGFCGPPKTFSNGCSLASSNCSNNKKYKYFHMGECKKKECPDDCFDIHAPVCALPNGFCGPPKTFGNSCYLQENNCKKAQKYKYFHGGKCLATRKAVGK